MTDALAHRGPDDRGTWMAEGAALGHRRLAVIAPSAEGRQPMHHGTMSLVFNGEIYNFQHLKARLRKAGRAFKTRTDTEALLQALDQWSPAETLKQLDGMFAVAVWDGSARRLVLARDRMGQKPLYYTSLPDGSLVFSSELRALMRHPEVNRAVDPTSLRKYLAYDYVPSPRSMIAGVHKLAPGHLLVWERGQIVREERWWDLPGPTATLTRERDATRTLWESIRSGVRSRLVSDVPLGVFLSGGLDSTAVATAAAELTDPTQLDTFCIGFDDPSFDESAHAEAVAAHLGTRHHTRRLSSGDLLGLLPEIIGTLDEPLADPSLVPTHLLSRFAREQVTVALGGDGGDELLLGYPTFGAHGLASLAARAPRRVRDALLKPAIRALPVSEKNWSLDYRLKRFVDGLDYDEWERHFVWIGGLAPDQHASLLEPAFYAAANDNPLDDVERLRRGWPSADDPMDTLTYLYSRLYLADGVLTKVDRASMAVGLECRAPLLSEEVITTCARIPSTLKLRGKSTKWILRRAMASKVPSAVLDRPKKGFGLPLTGWLKGPLMPLLQAHLGATDLRSQAIFKAESCEKLLHEHKMGWRDHRKVLWALLVFQMWWSSLGGEE